MTTMEDMKEGERARSLKPRLFSPVFVIVVLISLASFMVGQGSNSGTSVYLSEVGSTAAYAGVLAAIFSAAAAIARIVCGPIIDSHGRKVVMIVGSVIMLTGTLGPLFSHELGLFVLWRLLQGAGFSAVTTASATAAADVLPVERLGEGIGYFGLGQALAMSVGPALALFLVMTDPPENLFIGLSACAAAALLFSLVCRYEKDPQKLPKTSAYRFRWEEQHGEAAVTKTTEVKTEDLEPEYDAPTALGRLFDRFFERRALPGALPMLAIAPTFGFGIFYGGLYGTVLDIANPGLFYTISAVTMILVRLRTSAFIDEMPAIRIFTVAVGAGIVCYMLLLGAGVATDAVAAGCFYAAGAFYGVCLGLSVPVNQSVAVKNSPAHRWGKTNAFFLFANDVSIGLASLVWGIVNDTFGFAVTLVCVMVCLIGSLVVARICYPQSDRYWNAR